MRTSNDRNLTSSINESKLDDSISNNDVHISGYEIVRRSIEIEMAEVFVFTSKPE